MRTIEIGLQAPEPPPPPVGTPMPQPPKSQRPRWRLPSCLQPPHLLCLLSPRRAPSPPSFWSPRSGAVPTDARGASLAMPREEPGGASTSWAHFEASEVEDRGPAPSGEDASRVGARRRCGEGKPGRIGEDRLWSRPPTAAPQPAPAPAANPFRHRRPPAAAPGSIRVCVVSRLRPNPHCPESIPCRWQREGSHPGSVTSTSPAIPPTFLRAPPPPGSRTQSAHGTGADARAPSSRQRVWCAW